MTRIVLALAVLLAIAAPARAETGFLDREITVGGVVHRYQIYVPQGPAPGGQPWPVILDLHGKGPEGLDGLQQTEGGIAQAIRNHRAQFPAVVVLPQAQPGRRWLDTDMQDLAMAELGRTMTEVHADPTRVYLTGFSMGGTGAYRLAFRWPTRFAAVVVIAGRVTTFDVKTYPEADKQADRLANPFVAAPDPFAALAQGLRRLPILIAHGDADTTVPIEQSRRVVAALKAAGADLTYREAPGGGHVDTAIRTYADPATMAWLLGHRGK
jgi:predicted peptidase